MAADGIRVFITFADGHQETQDFWGMIGYAKWLCFEGRKYQARGAKTLDVQRWPEGELHNIYQESQHG